MRRKIHHILLASCLSVGAVCEASAASFDPSDPLYEDLGFTSNRQNVRIGTLLRRAFSWSDADGTFMINSVTLAYKRPPCTMGAKACEQRLQVALDRARTNRAQDWRSLGLLLESSAAFYRKMNLAGESLSLLNELVVLLTERAPQTEELCLAQIAYGQTASAVNRYFDAERSYNDALRIATELHDSNDETVLEIKSHLYYLYFNINRADRAIRCRKEIIAACGRDYIAERERSEGTVSVSTWPDILRSLDGVATSHDIADMERDADAEAIAALERANRGGPLIAKQEKPAKPQTDQGDKKDKQDPPPVPYRIYRGRDAR